MDCEESNDILKMNGADQTLLHFHYNLLNPINLSSPFTIRSPVHQQGA
jgi:hypothetical protein